MKHRKTTHRAQNLKVNLFLFFNYLHSAKIGQFSQMESILEFFTIVFIHFFPQNCSSILWTIDAHSFSNFFEGVHGVAKKSRRGSFIFVFYFIFMLQFFMNLSLDWVQRWSLSRWKNAVTTCILRPWFGTLFLNWF